MPNPDHNIGSINERSLHSQIKDWYSLETDDIEVNIGSYIIDIIRGDLLIEIQTGNFTSIRDKLRNLVQSNKVRLVYPISALKWVVRITTEGEEISRRRSPKKGKLSDLFTELVRIPDLVGEDNFSLEVLMIESEDIWCDDGKGSWRRRGASIIDRKLIDVRDSVVFSTRDDFLQFIPRNIEKPFTNKTIADELDMKINVVRKMTYCLRKMGAIEEVGRKGNTLLFDLNPLLP
ncbi:hypothetical protein J7L05_10240 [bacterium]|nr:hypothetical protein [bacterium]